jgi:hypothetical protein
VFDHSTGTFILRNSANVPIGALQQGWVRQYGGHADVCIDLGQALGEDLLQATRGRLSGFSLSKQADGTISFGWNFGMINSTSHGSRTVPESLRSAIEEAVRRALGR